MGQHMIKLFTWLGVCIMVFSGCQNDDGGDSVNEQLMIDQGLIETFLANNNLTAEKTNAGFYKIPIISNPGGETIEAGEIVSIYYNISIMNGAELHRLQAPELPLQVQFGRGLVAPLSIEWALTEMRTGEKYEFFMPSGFSFSNYSFENLIPVNAILRMEIEIVGLDTEESQRELERQRILTYMDEQGLTGSVEKTSGLFYVQASPGEGEKPFSLQSITVHYTGTFLNGTKFDSSVDRNQPFTFRLGQGNVIAGWDEGFQDLLKLEKGTLLIPSHLAYGANFHVIPAEITEDLVTQGLIPNHSIGIPPFSTLVFDVEVLDIRN